MINRAMGSHQSAAMITDTWLTPPELIKALGDFDLDPCTPIEMPWDTAKHRYTPNEDGLKQPWYGRVWLNPPYGKEAGKWLNTLAAHGNGIALIFARTETEMFFNSVWDKAHGILFIKGRLFFHYPDGTKAIANSGAPSVLIAYGSNNVECLEKLPVPGQFFNINR